MASAALKVFDGIYLREEPTVEIRHTPPMVEFDRLPGCQCGYPHEFKSSFDRAYMRYMFLSHMGDFHKTKKIGNRLDVDPESIIEPVPSVALQTLFDRSRQAHLAIMKRLKKERLARTFIDAKGNHFHLLERQGFIRFACYSHNTSIETYTLNKFI